MADAPIQIYNDNENLSENDATKTGSPEPIEAQKITTKPTTPSYSMLRENIENIAPDAIEMKSQIPTPTPKKQSAKVDKSDRAQDGAMAPTPVKVVRDLTQKEDTAPVAKEMETPMPAPTANEQSAITDKSDQTQDGAMAPTPVKVVKDLTQQQEGTLVRSALRSSIDRADTALLNDFLIRAQEKRAAKAATLTQEEATTEQSSSPDLSPDAECPTPTSRRVLEVMDENSSSTARAASPPTQETQINVQEQVEALGQPVLEEEEAPASPTVRRSRRSRRGTTPEPPTTISLRRATGTEFVFKQRTPAQELALTTTKNTRRNRGDAVFPQLVLEALREQTKALEEQEKALAEQAKDEQPVSAATTIREDSNEPKDPSTGRKSVRWNDDRLVEFSPDAPYWPPLPEETPEEQSPRRRPRQRRSRGQMEEESGHDTDSAPSAPTTAPAPKRVRRVGNSAMGAGTPVQTGSGSSRTSAPAAPADEVAGPSTPTRARRVLTPRSPSASGLPTPVSRSSTAPADQAVASGIPTRTPSTPAATSQGSRRRSREDNAGSTPMPRRVRART